MKFVAYYRVSTQRQGASGLGLDAQREAVESFVASRQGEVLAEFVEVESGKRNDRPQLAAALEAAKRSGAVLLIAKLDRLARNVHFISGLLEAGVEVQACDMPEANRFMLHVMSAVAEHEAAAISARTKAALAAAKARGKKLGWSIEGRAEEAKMASAAAAEVRVEAADKFAGQVGPLAVVLAAEGRSLRAIAAELNERGITTPRGKEWQATSVRNLLARVAA
jgi:DNA invertase Pin-like site-specific DNA recombinase